MNLKKQITETKLLKNQTALFYLGQVGFIIKYNDTYILIDGYLSDYVDKNCCSDTVKWIRKYPAPINGKELDFIDYALFTHEHYDHTDPYTIRDMLCTNTKAKFIISNSILPCLIKYGVPEERIIGADAGKSIGLNNGIEIMPIPSAHEKLNLDSKGRYMELGYKMIFGNTKIYHSGDCCMYDGLEDKISGCDIVILPINGRDYFRNKNDIIGCFDSSEAILLAKAAKAHMIIPVHFDLYAVNEVNPAHFVDTLTKLAPKLPFHIFAPGERYIFEK